jgi:hypothetical protein
LLASTIPRDWLKSVILAELFALCLLLMMLNAHGAVLTEAVKAGMPAGLAPGTRAWWNSSFAMAFGSFVEGGPFPSGIIARTSRLIEFTTNGSFGYRGNEYFYRRFASETDWQQIWTTLTIPGIRAWICGAAGMVIGAFVILLVATWVGTQRIESSWRDAPTDASLSEFRREYFSPRFRVESLKRRLSRALAANPIGWLQNYSASARLVKWSWCLVIIVVEIIFSRNSDDLYAAQSGL